MLRPGGTLHFVEHGLAPDEKVRHWQHRLDPLQQRLFGGCHLTRQIVDLITNAGFTISEVDELYEKGAPKIMGADTLGVLPSPHERTRTSSQGPTETRVSNEPPESVAQLAPSAGR